MRIGAHYLGNGRCEFAVWAPFLNKVAVKIVPSASSESEARIIPLSKDGNREHLWRGYWKAVADGVFPGTLYLYQLDGQKERPDPASFFQPDGVHKPSQVVDHRDCAFNWEDGSWRGVALSRMIIYELHVGTFTPAGTFEAVISRLDELKDIGINTIEIMPVSQFPGERNWGYDGVYPFAVQNSYGGPEGLKKLVNESHKRSMAVILDVVYNHFGPEGNYLRDFGPYFSTHYKTPWGDAINFDDAHSDEVRNFFIENALFWFQNYHLDALRLDAIHAIFDMSARPFLQDLAKRVKKFSRQTGSPCGMGRKFYLIAENDLNDSEWIRPREMGGYGLDGYWCDDFHHALHTLLTGESNGYYIDFATRPCGTARPRGGGIEHLIKSLREGFVYSGQYSRYRSRSHGISSLDRHADQMVVFGQNHDQVGNRMLGERLGTLVDFESLKLAAGVVLLSPFVPLLFMGEEYGETSPFLYFISHGDPALIEAVRKGRKEEFKEFIRTTQGLPADPQDLQTFLHSKIRWEMRENGKQKILLNFYQDLITIRKDIPAFSTLDKRCLDVCGFEDDRILFMKRWENNNHIHPDLMLCIFSFNHADRTLSASPYGGQWRKILDSSDDVWQGPGAILPESINPGRQITIRGRSLAVYTSYTSEEYFEQ